MPLGNGLINTTYKVVTAGDAPDYVLQHINTAIFPDVEMLMGNIVAVTGHIRKKYEAKSVADINRRVLSFVPANDGKYYYEHDGKFWREAGITVLRDDTASLAGITLIGRDDRTNPHRKPLEHIMRGIDRSKFLLEIDHQPYHLEEAERCGVDFEFAGHTHYGQVWPVNWITRAVFEDAFGPYRKGKTQYYVSSGLGIWGGKFRIGTRSEYIVLTINPA